MIEDLNTLIKRAEAIVNDKHENDNVRNVVAKLFDITEKWTPDDDSSWVDLGLPSGNLWYNRNVPGFHNFNEAKETFGKYLPKVTSMVELYENCSWKWIGKGYKVIGPNNNHIILMADGYKYSDGKGIRCVGVEGSYWTSCESKTSKTNACYLRFSSCGVYPLDSIYSFYEFSVRPCREL